MRGIVPFTACAALVAALVPYPGLLPFSLAGLALIYFATPPESRPRTRVVKRRGERGY